MKRALVISGVAWNSAWQRHHIVTKQLVDSGFSVDFFESIKSSKLTVKTAVKKINNKINSSKSNPLATNPVFEGLNIISISNAPPDLGVFSYLESIYYRRLFRNKNYDLVVCYIPRKLSLSIIESIRCDVVLYDCVRDFEEWGGYGKEVLEAHRWLVNYADYVFCDSYWIRERIERENNRDVVQILPTLPNDFEVKKRKISYNSSKKAIYFGSFSKHVDLSLLNYLNGIGFEIIFVGIKELPLPSYMKDHGYISDQKNLQDFISNHADLIIIPYAGTMDGVIPSKIMLSISTGIPILISSFYDSKRLSGDKRLLNSVYVYEDLRCVSSKLDEIFTCSFNMDSEYLIRKEFLDENRESRFSSEIDRIFSV